MNNKTLFKKAHKIARSTVAEVGNYQIAFKLALIELRSEPTATQKVKAFVVNLPSVFGIVTLTCLLLVIGGGFGGLMAYYGLTNSSVLEFILVYWLVALSIVTCYQFLIAGKQDFIDNYEHELIKVFQCLTGPHRH